MPNRQIPTAVPDNARAEYNRTLVRPSGVMVADVDAALNELAKRGLPFDEVLGVLVRASHREDHELTYTLPQLHSDLDRAYELQRAAGNDPHALVGAEAAEYRAAVNRAFHALCEVLARYDDGELERVSLDGLGEDVLPIVGTGPGNNWRELMAGVVCFHATQLRADPDPFELVLNDGGADPFVISIGRGEVRFRGQIRTPKAHHEPAEVSGYAGAVGQVRAEIQDEALRRGPVEPFRKIAEQLGDAQPELRDEIAALTAKLPAPLPKISPRRPLDAFGTQSEAAAELKRLGVPRALAQQLLGMAERSHPLRSIGLTARACVDG